MTSTLGSKRYRSGACIFLVAPFCRSGEMRSWRGRASVRLIHKSKIKSLVEDEVMQTTKILRNARRPLRSVVRKLNRWQNPMLAGTISDLSDDEIDEALAHAGLMRKDLFTPNNAIAQYRFRMACMVTALGIDVEQMVKDHWASLKDADFNCSRCTETGRCLRWLEWGRPNAAPTVFCPNAPVFMSIAAEQVDSRRRNSM
jgi:hypothetical protein